MQVSRDKQKSKPTARTATAPRLRRSQKERSAETRGKLLDAAIELLHDSGFTRLTVNDVAHRAGMSTGAVQHHFTSGHDLIRGVVDRVYPILRVPIERIAQPELGINQRIDLLIDQYWKIYRRPEYLVFWELMFGTRNDPELREFLRTLQRDLVGAIVADFVRAFADLRLSPKVAKTLWIFIGSQLRGLALLAIFEGAPILNADLVLLKESAHLQFAKQRPGKVRRIPRAR